MRVLFAFVYLNEGDIHQTGQPSEHFVLPDRTARAHLLNRFKTPATDKHRQPLKDDALGFCKQLLEEELAQV